MNDNTTGRRHVHSIKPGEHLVLNANDTTTKAKLVFADGAEVLVTLGRNQVLEMTLGTGPAPEIFLLDADAPAELREVDPT